MLIIFESILPIFLLVLLGVALKRSPLITQGFWGGLEQFGYYVLFPALLFQTLSKADFSSISGTSVSVTALLAFAAMTALSLALWPLFKTRGMGGPAYTSVFQTATRWNGFMALAIAEKISGAEGLVIVALVMAAIIVPVNLVNVGVMVWFSGQSRSMRAFAVKIVTNPIIIGAGLGVLVNLAGVRIYEPLMTAVDLMARSSLGLGLVTVGAGLQVMDALRPKPSVLLSTVMKLIIYPIIMTGLGLMMGLTGTALVMVALSAAVPTAMNGYLLAKQMGGDAELYAAGATVQTIAAFFTIPAVIYIVTQLAAG
ncbi:AEC family transporter [Peteryoungia desertarenae]|uniref:AEC family transporter n=1 Tax=Peteryoungia desertarenae TaxID=1813451 RepID=A0ABX6QPG4_9HYPH|nr:AEC family transporter [Peteryoungia desertarenae]QLF70142.1 AEC family transporter [Peteryoungia desertarenae]